MTATATSDCYYAVSLCQQSDDVIHPAYFPHRDLITQAKVLKARSAGNQANTLAVEYP